MVAKRKPKAGRNRERPRAPREEYVDYVVEIGGWDWGYSLSLNTMRRETDPYNEFRHLRVDGKLLHPTGLKIDEAEVLLLPSHSMQQERRKEFQPLALGGLDAYPNRIVGSLGIPMDVLPSILQMLIAGQFKYILMRGTRFRYRRARLHSFRVEMKLTEDDMPLADEVAGC